ncbi:hypothetical protein N7523_010576 [Penicillium sp. IBT 18751x]|nr:hypothetical protein N7523_010576 [Penicillium sp. IBT 18751x]
MTEFTELSPELLTLIVSLADLKSLKSLRLTNHLLSSYASRCLFRVIHLYCDEESCKNFEAVASHPVYKGTVQRIHLNTVTVDYDTDDEEEIPPPRVWRKPLKKLEQFSNLQSVVLRFDKNCAEDPDFADKPQTELYRRTVMQWLFAELASLDQPLKELAIQNHQNVPPRNNKLTEQIGQVLQHLTSLRLNVVHELCDAAPETEIEKPAPHDFFTRVLPSIWLKPAMGSLENLALYSTFYWGAYPKVNLDGVHFPQLKSLSLGHFSFVDDKQLDWILGHSETLQELYLDDCPILISMRFFEFESNLSNCQIPKSNMEIQDRNGQQEFHHTYPRRWHEMFSSIQRGLPHLRRFGFGVSESWHRFVLPFESEREIVQALMQDRYLAFDGGTGPSPFLEKENYLEFHPDKEWPQCDEEDRSALKELYEKIGQRVDYGTIEVHSDRTVEDLLQIPRGY